jgi:hypothetical protein
MEIPLPITAHDCQLTPAIESEIRDKAANLDTYAIATVCSNRALSGYSSVPRCSSWKTQC